MHAIHITAIVRRRMRNTHHDSAPHPPLVCVIRTPNHTATHKAHIRLVWTYYNPGFRNALILCPPPNETSAANGEDIRVAVAVAGAQQDSLRWLQLHQPSVGLADKCCAVCIRPIYGPNLSLWKVVEFVAHYRSIGANSFYIYDFDAPSGLKLLLARLQSAGVDVKLIPFKLIASSGDVHSHGQLPALYDCIFRSMSRMEYYIHVDFDELIVPVRHSSIPVMLQEIERKSSHRLGSLVVSNRYFCTDYPLNINYSDQKLPLRSEAKWRINIPGLLAIIFFYVVILAVGIWAGRKTNAPRRGTLSVSVGEQSNIMLAGRNIGLFVGVFTMTATWVGGGYINGTAEVVYISGLAWCQAPFGYALSLLIGGYLFAVKMRKAGYKTMLDPFQQHFGARMGCLLFLPALCGEVFWSAAILAALAVSVTQAPTVEVIMDFERTESVVASACIALFYTFTGGLYSVAYTDVIQLLAIFVGLVRAFCRLFPTITLPLIPHQEIDVQAQRNLFFTKLRSIQLEGFFSDRHAVDVRAVRQCSTKAVGPISYPKNDFVGSVEWKDFGIYWDSMLLLMMGGVPWQVYFQRVLSSRTAEGAELLSYMASFGCLFMAIPPVILGAVAKGGQRSHRVAVFTALTRFSFVRVHADLTQAGYTKAIPLTGEATTLTLPLVLQYLTPGFISAIGLGAVSAAVMSSSDSSILSAASMFAWNIYKLGIRQNATEKEVIGVMRVSIVLVGALATFMALTAESIYGLWYLSSDLVYVILFPQLVCVVYLKERVNTYGSFAAYVVGCVLRAGGGESILKIPPFIKYPFYDYENNQQLFPLQDLLDGPQLCHPGRGVWRSIVPLHVGALAFRLGRVQLLPA
ncbi:hypothetical protein MRX96_047819 [Rhipicephalus microplus]